MEKSGFNAVSASFVACFIVENKYYSLWCVNGSILLNWSFQTDVAYWTCSEKISEKDTRLCLNLYIVKYCKSIVSFIDRQTFQHVLFKEVIRTVEIVHILSMSEYGYSQTLLCGLNHFVQYVFQYIDISFVNLKENKGRLEIPRTSYCL